MKFVLLVYVDEESQEAATDTERDQVYASHGALFERLKADNAFVAGEEFKVSATATTVRNGKAGNMIEKGPAVVGREQLGGFYLIEAPDLSVALDYARTLPGTTEVRPIEAFRDSTGRP